MSATVTASKNSVPSAPNRLGGYQAHEGSCTREVVALATRDGSVLVVDRLAETLGDARLVARLSPDEPHENARIVAEMYLTDETRGRCRRLTDEDWQAPSPSDPAPSPQRAWVAHESLPDTAGHSYRIASVLQTRSCSQLRWTSEGGWPVNETPEPISLREVIAALESYEPASSMTAAALDAIRDVDSPSTVRLQGELERVRSSPIVLNRGLREAVQHSVSAGELTLSEIAIRCGRTKRGPRGTLSGETSWLARRIGALAEGGEAQPTRWVHSDTLALIAREGLGLSPNEVEL